MFPGFVRRPSFWVRFLPLLAILVSSVIASGGLLEFRRLRKERDALSEDTFHLLRENERLRSQILTLRRSDRDLERMAREELGLVRDGEIVYRFRSRKGAGSE